MTCYFPLGLQTSQDARFYAVSKKFQPFDNKDKDLVVQFSVKHEQNIDCGGGYIKVFDCSLEPKQLHGDTPYLLMFGNLYIIMFFFYIWIFIDSSKFSLVYNEIASLESFIIQLWMVDATGTRITMRSYICPMRIIKFVVGTLWRYKNK